MTDFLVVELDINILENRYLKLKSNHLSE